MELQKKRHYLLAAIVVTLILAAIVIRAMFASDYMAPGDNFRLEASKLLLQFLLVGIGGTLVLAYLNQRRDDAEELAARRSVALERASVRRAALQDLLRQIGDAHRRLKVVKRQLRAAIAREEPDPKDPPVRPYRAPAASFEKAIEALLNAQISAEEVRDRIAMSVELLDRAQIGRIRDAMHYGVRYFHDVYEDYEHCRIKREGDHFVITTACNNIHNFFFARELPTNLPGKDSAELRKQFEKMHEKCGTIEERHRAFMTIEELRKRDQDRRRRYRTIAAECFTLAADELRHELWTTCPAELVNDKSA